MQALRRRISNALMAVMCAPAAAPGRRSVQTRVERFVPVTDAMLQEPDDERPWRTWRTGGSEPTR